MSVDKPHGSHLEREQIKAGDVEIGWDIVEGGMLHRIEGWYQEGRGRMRILYGNQWHAISPFAVIKVVKR